MATHWITSFPSLHLTSLKPPSGCTLITLHNAAAKTLRLRGTSHVTETDLTIAFKKGGQTVAVAVQAEHSTGKNITALLGKAYSTILARDSHHPIEIDTNGGVPPKKPGAGAPPKLPTRAPRSLDRLVVIFVYDKADVNVARAVSGTVFSLQQLPYDVRPEVYHVAVDQANPQQGAADVQSILNIL
jgi:hypothetical protein